jgi:hypothetical protein
MGDMSFAHLKTPFFALCFSALAVFPYRPTGSEPAPVMADTAQLRAALAATFGGDFEIVRHELRSGLPERSGTFWLVHARPKRSGDFRLQYRYRYVDHVHPEAPLYTHVERESYIRVGERGCLRRRQAKDVCLGDTIILPFVLDDFSRHTFSLRYQGPASTDTLAREWTNEADRSSADPVPNPAAPTLRYVGSGASVRLHRRPGSTTVYSATFEAAAPGRLNLAVHAATPGEPASTSAAGSVPVIVVPRGQPVTVLLQNEHVRGVDDVRGFSSSSGNQYLTTALLLQPGDRITLEYHSVTVNGFDHPMPGTGQVGESVRGRGGIFAVQPAIERFPFSLDPRDRFNAWIVRHLPAQRSCGARC